jgi:tetratricopeptide (TPR) repeat protein
MFPLAFIILGKSNLFDGWRHLTFVYPPLVVCCAIAWDRLIDTIPKKTAQIAMAIGLSVLISEPLLWMIGNHPLEQFYFSPVIGGTKGAWKNYEIDYYGTSLRNAVEWIADNSDTLQKGPNGKIRVRIFYGERECGEHFIKKYDKLEYVYANEESIDWDYYIVLPVQAKYDQNLLKNWPPKGMVHQVEIDGAPVVAILKNYRIAIKNDIKDFSIYECNDVSVLINISVKYYQTSDFFNCIAACEKALLLSPDNTVAYSNIASAFNNLYLFDEAMDYANKALKIDPNFELAKGNLNVAMERKKQLVNANKDGLANNYLNTSVIYFNLKEFDQCIKFSKKALQLTPQSAVAYNNIGASYNAESQFAKAEAAFSEALKINPGFELAKNNLAMARKSMGK